MAVKEDIYTHKWCFFSFWERVVSTKVKFRVNESFRFGEKIKVAVTAMF
jgi:hypothetical protein